MSLKFEDVFLTKEYIEDHLSAEEIFEFYAYPVDFTKKYKNPWREDNNPDCTYYVSKTGNLYFVDNSWNKKHYNCYSACMAHYGISSFRESLKMIYLDMIVGRELGDRHQELKEIKKNRIENTPLVLKVKVKPFTEKELNFWKIGGLDVTPQELQSKGIYSIDCFWENNLIHDNLKNYFVYVNNGVVNQIYAPLRDKTFRRFINRTGFKFSYPTIKNDSKILILSKSGKDQFFIEKFGVPCGYNVNETVLLDREIFEQLKKEYTHIFSLFDPDRQGFHSAWMHRKEYGIQPIFISKEKRKNFLIKSKPKDFTEYLSEYGYQSVIDEIEYLKKLI